MAIKKLFSVTAKNQLQLVALLMKENQRLVLLLFHTFRVFNGTHQENFDDNEYIGQTKVSLVHV